MSNKITQEAIVSKEPKSSSTQSKRQQRNRTNKTPIVKSRKRTSLEEFSLRKNLRPEVKAGFKMWLKGKVFQFDEDWEILFEQYRNR